MDHLPTGTVTFLFTDIEGSTRLWERSPAAMKAALGRHDTLVRHAIEAHGGHVFKTIGDAFCAAFAAAGDAVAAALAAQQALLCEPWPDGATINARMVVHTGSADAQAGDYFGPTLNRTARLLAVGNGRQVLLSAASVAAAGGALPDGASLQDRGTHRLKDLGEPERLFQLCHATLPSALAPLRSLSAHPNNLPLQTTSFVGRDRELAQVKSMLARSRLVTLTGAGGCGKTRLALQVAAEVLELFPDGAWLAELAALSEPQLVAHAVAAASGASERAGHAILDSLVEHVAHRRMLLVVDNAEHVIDACALLVDGLLRRCPNVVVLVTSRQPLQIAGEATLRVPSMRAPDERRDITADAVSRYESARLFVERAQAHQPAFALTDRNAAALASLCRRLDGIPLAIELAAARVRSMSLEEVSRRLDQRFALLTGGSRAALPRQQTLRALIDWSYNLLTADEQELFCRLAVFSGGHTLEAAENVCSDDRIEAWRVVDLLGALVDKSLVVPEERMGATRYRKLETVREYVRDRLLERSDGASWRQRHFEYFRALAERAEPELIGADQQAWFDRLDLEHDNLRVALAWCAQDDGNPADGVALANTLWRFWYTRGHAAEGRRWFTRLVDVAPREPPSLDRAKALTCLGMFAHQQGDYPFAVERYEEGLAMRRALGDRRGIASSLNNLGVAAQERGDLPRARLLYEEALALMRELGDRHAVASVLSNLGSVTANARDYAAARAYHEESLGIRRELRDLKGVAQSLGNLGSVLSSLGEYATARGYHEEAVAMLRELGDSHGLASPLNNLAALIADQADFAAARAIYEENLRLQHQLGNRWGVASVLEGLGHVALGQGRIERAARLWGCAESLREEIGVPLHADEAPRLAGQLSAARAALHDDAAFDRAWRQGRAMTLDEAVGYARAPDEPSKEAGAHG
ncbi:MAG TPA: tetratricopeptide repeat protein [Casimicrobiaceae bacterium]|nr:tetratricopeptide repeat protein [Casimicrobiaceae bacterium]